MPSPPKSDDADAEEKQFTKNLAQRLRAVRDFYGLTQQEWATILQLRPDAISHYEQGDRGVPYYVLARVALVAQIPVGLLLLGRVSPISDKRIEALQRTHPVMTETAWRPSEKDCRALRAILQLAGG